MAGEVTVTLGRLSIDEVLEMDLRRLRTPEGGMLDPERHRVLLASSLPRAAAVGVRREGKLVAYAYLWPLERDDWFVGGLVVDERTAVAVLALRTGFLDLVTELGADRLHSHVLRANADSLRLHQRLGFAVTREDVRAIAFVAEAGMLRERLARRAGA